MKKIVVFSGGMDSTVALKLALVAALNKKEDVTALSFNYGSKHNERELRAARKICGIYGVKHEIIELPFIEQLFTSTLLKAGGDIPEGHYKDESMRSTVVPFRNGIMLAIAAGYAESSFATTIYLGNHFGDHAIYPDCRSDFVLAMEKAIGEGTYNNIKLYTPFTNLNKEQICALGSNLDVPLDLTYSCYNGREKHCGSCGTCVERKEAFLLAGVEDRTEYE